MSMIQVNAIKRYQTELQNATKENEEFNKELDQHVFANDLSMLFLYFSDNKVYHNLFDGGLI
jgi:hypothetical protein